MRWIVLPINVYLAGQIVVFEKKLPSFLTKIKKIGYSITDDFDECDHYPPLSEVLGELSVSVNSQSTQVLHSMVSIKKQILSRKNLFDVNIDLKPNLLVTGFFRDCYFGPGWAMQREAVDSIGLEYSEFAYSPPPEVLPPHRTFFGLSYYVKIYLGCE